MLVQNILSVFTFGLIKLHKFRNSGFLWSWSHFQYSPMVHIAGGSHGRYHRNRTGPSMQRVLQGIYTLWCMGSDYIVEKYSSSLPEATTNQLW